MTTHGDIGARPGIRSPALPNPVTPMPTARVPGMLQRCAARPARWPKTMWPTQLMPNAVAYRCGVRR